MVDRPHQSVSPQTGAPSLSSLLRARLRTEWTDQKTAIGYLRSAGFALRNNGSWRPPTGRKRLTPVECRAIEYLLLEHGFDGLLTDRQNKQRCAEALA